MATDNGARHACPDYELALENYLNGDLTGADAQRAAAHISSCAACADAWEGAVASTALLRATASTDGPGPAFSRTVMARIRAAEAERGIERLGFWQPFVSFGWRFAVTATVAVGLLVTYDAGWARRSQPNTVAARPIVRDLFTPDPVNTPANGDEALMMVAETNHGNH
ncbi:MAG TPA: zf-HC2 domain-containing protein [Candidatus Acidoferrales bacterium]|jgi:anti-sigma factor RsiW|nr:zf-HC2 domain-containing protein [Candidatus Acidoferrales bacterium]